MEQLLNEIRIASTDSRINERLKSLSAPSVEYTRHYNQTEEFFLKLPTTFTVPSFAIHHDVRVPVPSTDYIGKLRAVVDEVSEYVPGILSGLTYVFDPAEILRPQFFQLYRYAERSYLFLLRIDLLPRLQEYEILERGGNDFTASYLSDRLYLEAELIPLDAVNSEGDKISGFRVRQSISATWIGERGRGYFVQGIWIDREITKFLSKLFIPAGKRMYPYYPFTCRHRAICLSLVRPEAENRKQEVPKLHRASAFLEPHMRTIEEALQGNDFSENLDAFKSLKARIPPEWDTAWDSVRLRMYLNDKDMKEYQLEDKA